MGNGYINTSCQRTGVPVFSGCVEHSTIIWGQIQTAKREKNTTAYGSVLHQLIDFAMEFFHMPDCFRGLVASYSKDLQMCFALQDFTTVWQQLEVGISIGCSISPILFVAALEITLIDARQMV